MPGAWDTERTSETRRRIVVIGGGINGLAAAWRAHEESRPTGAEVLLLEADQVVGGKARTRREGEWLFEEGPTGYLSGEPVLDELIDRAQIEAVPADQAAARRYVVRGGRAREIKTSPVGFASSGILSPLGLLRLLREPWIAPIRGGDETIWDFAERRLGRQVAERLIAPMVLGVFAGDATKLSLPAAFPRMRELEERHGSLFRAMFRLARERGATGGPAGPAGRLHSFAGGMQSLPLALAERAPFTVRTGARVTKLTHDAGHAAWALRIEGDAEPLFADAIVLSCEPHPAAELLRTSLPEVASELSAITCPGLAVIGLGYDSPRSIERLPVGFGALIPRTEGLRSLGVLFDTQLFEQRSPQGHTLVRCMIGGATDPEAASLDEQELVRIATEDVRQLFGCPDTPTHHQVTRWAKAIPQYELGHLDRVQHIDAALEAFRSHTPGLFLAGCHARGVAFAKTAREGWCVGELAARSLVRT